MQYTCSYSSPLGEMLIASDGSAVTGLWFIGQKYFGSTLEAEHAEKALPVFGQTVRWLDDYFQGNVPMEMPPVSFNSSSFRIRVWKLLMEIPYGHTVTYGEIARTLEKQTGRRICAQAVGGAVGHNPVSIIVPCHRVIGSNGLTGYAGGLDKKLALLRLEGINVH